MTDFLTRMRARRVFDAAGEGEPGAGEDTAAAAGGDDTQAAGEGGEGGSTRWWEDAKRFDDGTRSMLAAKGLTVDDPVDALGKLTGMYSAAEKRLGKSPDRLMDRPAEGQDVTEWMRGNAELFGIPEAADGYKIERPESWPKDAPWDDKAEAALRAKAHEAGLNGTQAQAMVDTYAGLVSETLTGAEKGAEQAQAALMGELQKDWGDQTKAKVAQAQQAWTAAAEMAGLDSDAALNAAQVLTEKTGGDANVLRLFAALGDMMGEDMLPRDSAGSGGLGTTPADARAELAAMKAPDSAYSKAIKEKQQTGRSAEFERLHKRFLYLQKKAG